MTSFYCLIHQWGCLNGESSANRLPQHYDELPPINVHPTNHNHQQCLPTLWWFINIFTSQRHPATNNSNTFHVHSKIAFSHVTIPTHTHERARLAWVKIASTVMTSNGQVEACAGNIIMERIAYPLDLRKSCANWSSKWNCFQFVAQAIVWSSSFPD